MIRTGGERNEKIILSVSYMEGPVLSGSDGLIPKMEWKNLPLHSSSGPNMLQYNQGCSCQLFPKPICFIFYYCNLIGILAGIGGVGFRFGAVQFVRLKMLLTIVVPPAIPVTLLSGASFAITGFRRQGTHCIAPSRVNIVQRLLLSADLD